LRSRQPTGRLVLNLIQKHSTNLDKTVLYKTITTSGSSSNSCISTAKLLIKAPGVYLYIWQTSPPWAFNRDLVHIGDPTFIYILYKWQNTGIRQSGKLMLITLW